MPNIPEYDPVYTTEPVTDIDIMFVGSVSRSLTLLKEDTLEQLFDSDEISITLSNRQFGPGSPEVIIIPRQNILFYSIRQTTRRFAVRPGPTEANTPPPPSSTDSAPAAPTAPSGPHAGSSKRSPAPQPPRLRGTAGRSRAKRLASRTSGS